MVQLLDLPAAGWHWHAPVSRESLEDAGRGEVDALAGLCSDAFWHVDLEHAGDCYHLHGHWQVEVQRHCRRCNVPFVLDMRGDTLRDYRVSDMPAEGAEDVLPPPGHIDLLDVLREDVWLAWQASVLCKPDCKGLCQRCGQNLNEGTCRCKADEGEHPFAALRHLKVQLKPKE